MSYLQHHPHHPPPGPPPLHLQQRPSSIVHQHHQAPQHSPHQAAYPSPHGLPPGYSQTGPNAAAPHAQPDIPYYTSHPSPYSASSTSGGYSAASEAPEIMAAAQMTRPYPQIYHTPQSNSPASVTSSSGHEHQQRMYGAPAPSMQQTPMYYPGPPPPSQQHQQYPPTMPSNGPSYQHAQQHQHQQQQQQQQQTPAQQQQQQQPPHPQNMHSQHTLQHYANHHAALQQQNQQQQQQQQQQPPLTGSPRLKIEPQVGQMPRSATTPLGPPPAQAGTPQMNANHLPGQGPGNANAAPGPIPATTPLVVRQDNNGVQWIAFEYSRDRVKMEYTIRCDVESVAVEQLSAEFKQENCVYPRACCAKDQYRGNRLIYETECNTVGWALAELNTCLRGKRGLIQRAVDSWRNSNADPRLRSRRVRRQAKITNRKTIAPGAPQMAGPSPTSMTPAAVMGQNNVGSMKPSMAGAMPAQMHHHHAHPEGGQGAADVDNGAPSSAYLDPQVRAHQPSPSTTAAGRPDTTATGSMHSHADDVRQAHLYRSYAGQPAYPAPPSSLGGASLPPSMHHAPPQHHRSLHAGVIAASTTSPPPSTSRASISHTQDVEDLTHLTSSSLFTDLPETRKRKFILVDDPSGKGGRVRVRVTLDSVNTEAIPDSFRKSNSVYPRSWWGTEMGVMIPESWAMDLAEEEGDKDGGDEVDAGTSRRGHGRGRGAMRRGAVDLERGAIMASEDSRIMVTVPTGDKDAESAQVANPSMRRWQRRKEVKLNDLGYRMTWHQSRVFSGRVVFLQKALDSYRNKVAKAIEDASHDVSTLAPHFETRPGKRRWCERLGEGRAVGSGSGGGVTAAKGMDNDVDASD